MTAITPPALIPPRAPAGSLGRAVRGNGEFIAGVIILLGLLVVGVVVTLTNPGGITRIGDVPFAGPSPDHLLGTDNLARDNLTRLGAAAITGLRISFLASLIAAAIGVIAGVTAGYLGGLTDTIIMRVVDMMLAVPAILLALVARVILGPGEWTLIIALAVICSATFARVIRAPVIALREQDFVTSAEISGVPRPVIGAVHIVPNVMTPLLVQFAATASAVVLLESILSFLGQGVLPPDPSAGRMIADATRFMARDPLLTILPATLVVLITVGWNLTADGLQKLFSARRGAVHISRDSSRALITPRDSSRASINKES